MPSCYQIFIDINSNLKRPIKGTSPPEYEKCRITTILLKEGLRKLASLLSLGVNKFITKEIIINECGYEFKEELKKLSIAKENVDEFLRGSDEEILFKLNFYYFKLKNLKNYLDQTF